jgi:DNA-binding NarL/FixJ family response regulator
VLIVEDQELMRLALRDFLQAAYPVAGALVAGPVPGRA